MRGVGRLGSSCRNGRGGDPATVRPPPGWAGARDPDRAGALAPPAADTPAPIRLGPWNYWWQAHLLDCLVDAQRRAPQPWRAVEIAALARTVRLRNLGSWTNRYDRGEAR